MQNRNLERFLGNGNASEEFVLLIEDKNKSYKYEISSEKLLLQKLVLLTSTTIMVAFHLVVTKSLIMNT